LFIAALFIFFKSNVSKVPCLRKEVLRGQENHELASREDVAGATGGEQAAGAGWAGRRAMRQRAVVALLGTLLCGSAWGQDVSVYGVTMAEMWKAETPGFEKATFMPATQYLGIDATNLTTERLSFHLFGWGRADLGEQSSYTGKTGGDLAYGYLRYRFPTANAEIKAGRFSVSSSSGIEQVDGVSAKADLKGGFTVSAFGGQPVLYKKAMTSGAAQDDYEFQRNFIVGARIGLRVAKVGEFGLSYLQDGQTAAKDLPIPSDTDYTRRHVGLDMRIAPHAAVEFSGKTVLDVAKHPATTDSPSNIAEHDYTLSVKAMDELAFAGTYTERNYRAYFAGTNLHSLFHQDEKGKFNAMGASVTWGSAGKLQVVADFKHTKREIYGDANRVGADVKWAISGMKLNTGFGFHKVSADDVKVAGGTIPSYGLSHTELRAWVMHEKGKLFASLDGIFYTFDDSKNPNLNDKSSLFEVVGSLGYQATANVKVSGDLSYGANPDVKKEVRALLRAEYRFGGPASKGGKK
jgi:hypothetical protein